MGRVERGESKRMEKNGKQDPKRPKRPTKRPTNGPKKSFVAVNKKTHLAAPRPAAQGQKA